MTRTARRTIATLGVAAMTMGAAATTAHAGQGDSIKGTVSGPGVEFTVDAADGNLQNSRIFGSVKIGDEAPMRAEGPVTCLEVQGNQVGLFYPMEESSPSLMSMLGLGVYMNMTVENGEAKSISFSVVPKTRGGCEPAPTFMPASGSLATTDGG